MSVLNGKTSMKNNLILLRKAMHYDDNVMQWILKAP